MATKSSAKKSGGTKASADPKSTAKKSAATKAAPAGALAAPFTDALRVGPGFVLADRDPRSTPAFDGGKAEGEAALTAHDDELGTLQEQLYAMSKAGSRRRVLLVVQGMDTSGKGGIMRHVVGAVDPQGVRITAFKAPSPEERRHPFLWRIRRAVPEPGMIGVFDRSHYEDVLIVRVHDLVPRSQWSRRYASINAFEQQLVDDEVTIIKVMLHISPEEQKARLEQRLARPDKHWKYNPGDLVERERWADYQEAYQALLERCSPAHAPWFVVPADRKWYARLAVKNLLLEHLRGLDLAYPAADFDVAAEQERLAGM